MGEKMNGKAIMPREFYGRLEPKIRSLVEAINRLGFYAFESCEGHIEDEKHPYPYVWIGVPPGHDFSSEILIKKLSIWNGKNGKEKWLLVPDSWDECPEGFALMLRPENENKERSVSVLLSLQNNTLALATLLFLKNPSQ